MRTAAVALVAIQCLLHSSRLLGQVTVIEEGEVYADRPPAGGVEAQSIVGIWRAFRDPQSRAQIDIATVNYDFQTWQFFASGAGSWSKGQTNLRGTVEQKSLGWKKDGNRVLVRVGRDGGWEEAQISGNRLAVGQAKAYRVTKPVGRWRDLDGNEYVFGADGTEGGPLATLKWTWNSQYGQIDYAVSRTSATHAGNAIIKSGGRILWPTQ